jgi:uncharacterized protein (DUF1697 family)
MPVKQNYVALLRAVNVGGRFVRMERLRALFEELGLKRVRTFIQSGNVFFESGAANRTTLARRIEAHLGAELGFECPVFLRTIGELEQALAIDAFDTVKVTPQTRLAVLFLAKPLPASVVLPHRSPKGDCEILAVTPGEAFAVLHQQDGRPGNPAAYMEKAFGINTTVRFHHTALKMLAAAKKA